jgi:uracil-DNA glycosylase family 4
MPELKTTPFQRHKRRWIDCRRCGLCERRKKVVLVRGRLPCDVLFIGEAPGDSEDVIGLPFKGPAGHEFDSIIAPALEPRIVEVKGKLKSVEVRWAMTNLIACIPKGEDNRKAAEPPKFAIDSCAPRLKEVVEMAQPSLIVCVGQFATKHAHKSIGLKERPGDYAWLDITHPAAIIRMDITQQGLARQRCRVAVTDAIDALFT